MVSERAGAGFVLPSDQDRITIIGKTGSGKTQGAVWHLSRRRFDKMPWVVLNWKHDELIDSIPGLQRVSVTGKVPKKPGLYVAHPTPADVDAVDDFLWRIWAQENIGVFIDEGYMIPARSPSYQAILTQGRSKRIPVMTLTQRPAWVSRFAFSEADFIQLYQLADTRDTKVVKQFMPLPIDNPLPAPYWSWWWDNKNNFKSILKPVPARDIILETIYDRLHKPKRVL